MTATNDRECEFADAETSRTTIRRHHRRQYTTLLTQASARANGSSGRQRTLHHRDFNGSFQSEADA
jgi:hypothetical protein